MRIGPIQVVKVANAGSKLVFRITAIEATVTLASGEKLRHNCGDAAYLPDGDSTTVEWGQPGQTESITLKVEAGKPNFEWTPPKDD